MSTYTLVHSKIEDYLSAYSGNPYHAVLCDPPYHLTSKDGSAKGFMNAEWDGGDIAFRPELWASVARCCHAGALILAFASTRGSHRMATAMENAGLIIQNTIYWIYGSGFPKGANISKLVDKRAGAEREIVGSDKGWANQSGIYNDMNKTWDLTNPATDLARAWQHHRYNPQSLKPAVEPIIVAQVPFTGAALDNILKTGAGAYNLSERVGSAEEYSLKNVITGGKGIYGDYSKREYVKGASGRIPANVVLSHTPECTPEQCAEGCVMPYMDQQSGYSETREGFGTWKTGYSASEAQKNYTPSFFPHNDSGGASRYFHQSFYTLEKLEQQAFIYESKVSPQERDAGLEHFTPRTTNDGRNTPIDNAYQRGETERKNFHPTLKPIELTTHLARLLLPPDEYAPRRLLVPFAGTGSEMIGGVRAGWDHVEGVEMTGEYAEVAQHRLKYWSLGYATTQDSSDNDDPPQIASNGQMTLF